MSKSTNHIKRILVYADWINLGGAVLMGTLYIIRYGAQPDTDLEELWRRIVFSICVSNSDDHLRNHGFLLTHQGWKLSPAFDINPIPLSTGLSLNISEHSNELDLDLAREVAEKFRVNKVQREMIISKVIQAVSRWKEVAGRIGISSGEIRYMEGVFIN
jgi:serine/threonine-protein kinase HipA